jgi:hypothetical protein
VSRCRATGAAQGTLRRSATGFPFLHSAPAIFSEAWSARQTTSFLAVWPLPVAKQMLCEGVDITLRRHQCGLPLPALGRRARMTVPGTTFPFGCPRASSDTLARFTRLSRRPSAKSAPGQLSLPSHGFTYVRCLVDFRLLPKAPKLRQSWGLFCPLRFPRKASHTLASHALSSVALLRKIPPPLTTTPIQAPADMSCVVHSMW